MLNTASRTWLVGGVWLATLALVIAGSVAMGARISTTALLLALSVAPAGIILLIGLGAPPPTVAEVLYTVHKS
jgi:hypothetical protein